MEENRNKLVIEIADKALELISGVPVLSTISEIMKNYYYENIRNKWATFLKYAMDIREFFNEIEQNPKLLQYLSDYFESIRTTPSFLAIKTMALILRDFQEDERMQQRTCRAFAGISDEELNMFIKLYTDIKYNNQKISIKKECLEEKSNDDLRFYINDLSNRGFLFLTTNTGLVKPETDFDFNFTLEFNKTSKMYYDYLNKAKKLENYHVGSKINKQ